MADAFKIKFDPSAMLAAMDSVAAGIAAQTRPAAQAGAQELYNEVKRNVAKLGRKTGNLDASIYQVFSKDNSNDKKSTYHVSWNHKKAPHGHLLENGTSRSPAYPFIRPAHDAANQAALQAAADKFAEGAKQVMDGAK